MQFSMSEMPQNLILALDHHKQLIEDAHRQRQSRIARRSSLERPMRWRRLRSYVGEMLIYFGQRLKPDATDTVWG